MQERILYMDGMGNIETLQKKKNMLNSSPNDVQKV